ncbi:hypothetical protein BC831DRAFT_443389 [Entophlyctis helioformis]|nr:hypothetical protein BC831DRAFT_443389 [Entophlyctis helioformis]
MQQQQQQQSLNSPLNATTGKPLALRKTSGPPPPIPQYALASHPPPATGPSNTVK